jgi:hypothetical protein
VESRLSTPAKYQRAAHVNKHGKAYPKAKNDADRY